MRGCGDPLLMHLRWCLGYSTEKFGWSLEDTRKKRKAIPNNIMNQFGKLEAYCPYPFFSQQQALRVQSFHRHTDGL